MVDTKPVEDVVRKWKSRAAVAEPEYRAGINRAKDWQGETSKSADRYATGVSAAIADGRFAKGVSEVSNSEWKNKALGKGASRFGPGVAASEADFRSGIAEVLNTIQGVTLPDRQPAGSPGNIERVRVIADALHKMKIGV